MLQNAYSMHRLLLHSLDIFFFLFHTTFILFNVFGALVPRWRTANFITLSATAFSWFVLGIWYGWGYCFCTDWHWRVRESLGYRTTSNSYIQFLIAHLTGIYFPEEIVNTVTAIVFFAAYAISIGLMLKRWRQIHINKIPQR
jgi:hypothetical protein